MSKEDFYSLTPDIALQAVDSMGFRTTGELLQLNSYENRVFEIALESIPKEKLIAKFYRPGRWDEATILEEHDFLYDLEGYGLPVIAPIRGKGGKSLSFLNHMWTAVFPKARGRMVQELDEAGLRKLGRTLGHLHNIGEQKEFKHRPSLTTQAYGYDNLLILDKWIAPEVRNRYLAAANDILRFLDEMMFEEDFIRIHGDCHKGNLLETDVGGENREFFFVDFDDCVMGPPIQDFWMLLSGDEEENQSELFAIIEGYEEFRNFSDEQIDLIPGLRGLRIIHYAGWIARRWDDPSFPRLFPQFREYNYWATETEALEKIARRLDG
jgi:Ser/Thr protein kinase RdoA (MazF antagonist)